MGCKRKVKELVVNKIQIKERGNQKIILHAISEELTPLTTYRLIMGQPIPEEGEALPLFIKVHEGTMFAPKVRVVEDDDCDCDCDEDEEFFDEEEFCGEKKRSRLIPVDKFGLGNVAFGIDLTSCKKCREDMPRRCLKVFLTNGGEFTLLKRERDED